MKTIGEDSAMLSNLPETLEVYRAAWSILTKMSIEEIDVQETGLDWLDQQIDT